MITLEHDHHVHHHHRRHDRAQSNLIENIYVRTHKVLRFPRKLRREGYNWEEITDECRIKTIRDEIAEIEQRLGRTGEFDNLRPLQQEVFINGFAYEHDNLVETHHDRHDDHTHGEECNHDHRILNRFIKNPKIKRIAAGILCQFDCTIPAALNIVGALFGGAHGVDHHDGSAILAPQPQIIFEYRGKQLATIPVNRQVTQEELEKLMPATRTLIAEHIEQPPSPQRKLTKRQAKKAAQREANNEKIWQNWLLKQTQWRNPLAEWAIKELQKKEYVGRHRAQEIA